MFLSIGKKYSLYTNYNTIINQKVEVVAILSYNECKKVSYDISVLGINERVISVKDENIEEAIGSDNIYHCRAINPNSDGTYSEFLVWDSIINMNKTTAIGENYKCGVTLNITPTAEFTLQQVLNTMQAAVKTTYGNKANVTFSATVLDDVATTKNENELSDEKINDIKAIINEINKWQDTLIPMIEKISNTGLSEVIDNINTQLLNISSNISMAKHAL